MVGKRAAAYAGLFLLTLVTYLGAIPAGFVYEDWNATGYSRATALAVQPLRVRSLTRASYALDRWVGGNMPWAYHLTNMVLHAGNVVLVAVLVMELSGWLLLAIAAAGIFAIHPMNAEAVYYIAGRTELLSTGLILIAVIECLRQRWVGMGVAFALAVMAKESAVAGAGLIVLLGVSQYAFRFRDDRRVWAITAALGVIAALAGISVFRHEYFAAMQSPLGWEEYAALQATALWHFLGMILLPLPQFFTVDHDFEIIGQRWQILALGSLWVVAVLVGVIWWLREDIWWNTPWTLGAERILLGLIWAGIALAPRFVLRIPEVLNEHQMYLAMVGLSLVLAEIGRIIYTWAVLGRQREPIVVIPRVSSISVPQLDW